MEERTAALRRGRPSATSRAHVVRSALDLFARQGFEATTLEQVAEEAELAPSVVLRSYASTSAIVWEGQDKALRALVGELEAVPPGVPWRSALVEVLLAAQHQPDGDLDLLRRRLLLVEAVPVLALHAHTSAAPAVAALAAFVARRTGEDPGGVVAYALARAVWEASRAALLWWARSGGDDPAAAVRAGLAAIGFTSP